MWVRLSYYSAQVLNLVLFSVRDKLSSNLLSEPNLPLLILSRSLLSGIYFSHQKENETMYMYLTCVCLRRVRLHNWLYV